MVDDTRKRLQADVHAGCEVQVDWSLLGHGNPKNHDLFAPPEDRKSVVAWNTQEQSAPSQVGGVAMMVTGLVSNYTKPNSSNDGRGRDPRGLGRWCSLLMEGSCGPARLVTYYRPHGPTKTEGEILKGLREPKDVTKVSLSAWAQQKRYYKAKGMFAADPRSEADNDLLHQLRKWKQQNEEIILLGDFNQNVYTS